MNEKNRREDEAMARLIKAGYSKTVRPSPEAREQAWKRVKTAWQNQIKSTDASQNATANSVIPDHCEHPSESQNKTNNKENSLMSMFLRNRWKWGLGTAVGAMAAVIVLTITTSTKALATPQEVMIRGAQAVAQLTCVHLKGQLRTPPDDNFSLIDSNLDFCTIELWKQINPDLKWRIEKPGRVVLMDGKTTLMYIKEGKIAAKFNQSTENAFDTEWLHRIANLSMTISNELRLAQAKGCKLELATKTATDGSLKDIVTIHTKAGLPEDDYLKNRYLEDTDTRRVYQFDDKTELLENVQYYMVLPNTEVLLFELSQVEYNHPIGSGVWELALPEDVAYYQPPQKLPDNERYAAMTSEQAAKAFLEACGKEDWNEVGKFLSPLSSQTKKNMGGLEIISLGKPFTSQDYAGDFVPYEIKLRPVIINVRVANTNAAKRFVLTGNYDEKFNLLEDMKLSAEPEVLTNNGDYAKLSPTEAVQAYFNAQAKLDWVEMSKFTSKYNVETLQHDAEVIQKQGFDVKNVIPVVKVIEAVKTPDQSGYFVKCIKTSIKKQNLALRKDNPAERWQVDGGF